MKQGNEGTKNFQVKAQSKETLQPSDMHRITTVFLGLPWWLRGKEAVSQCRRCGFDPLGREDPLEKEMATHSSILAWRLPWTEPGGLQLMGWQKNQTQLSHQTATTN